MSKDPSKQKAEKKWKELKDYVKKQRTSPLSMAADVREKAAELYESFLESLPLKEKKLVWVTLKLDAPYPTEVPREQIPDMIRKSPEFFKDWAEATGD